MRKAVLLSASIFLGSCSTLDPVVITDVEGEYVVVGRDTTPFVSLESRAEKNAIKGAVKFCDKLGKEYKKRYAMHSPMGGAKWADSTLYFKCVDKADSTNSGAQRKP